MTKAAATVKLMAPDDLADLRRRYGHTRPFGPLFDHIEVLERMATVQKRRDAPEVVCLCGSTRFMDAYHDANRALSLEGKIVLTVEIVTYDGATDPQRANPEQKAMLDELHLRKIDLADRVHVLNVGGYVGESTAKEIDYARQQGKTITWLEATHER